MVLIATSGQMTGDTVNALLLLDTRILVAAILCEKFCKDSVYGTAIAALPIVIVPKSISVSEAVSPNVVVAGSASSTDKFSIAGVCATPVRSVTSGIVVTTPEISLNDNSNVSVSVPLKFGA